MVLIIERYYTTCLTGRLTNQLFICVHVQGRGGGRGEGEGGEEGWGTGGQGEGQEGGGNAYPYLVFPYEWTITTLFPLQGDRMWGFAVPIFFALLYPGSLLLPGIYGFLIQLSIAMFGTVVGDWVDINPRMKGRSSSLETRLGSIG